jgi:hypothetical protein
VLPQFLKGEDDFFTYEQLLLLAPFLMSQTKAFPLTPAAATPALVQSVQCSAHLSNELFRHLQLAMVFAEVIIVLSAQCIIHLAPPNPIPVAFLILAF